MVVNWATLNNEPIGTILNSSSWEHPTGIIADQTRSGKFKIRINHVQAPNVFNITMHMTEEEYQVFDYWWKNVCRKGFYSFYYPKINGVSKENVEYQFLADQKIDVKNTSALNLELTMVWLEA